MQEIRTQVVIVGAGPAGLVLGHLLHLEGIDNVILERRSRDYVEHRVRAGVLEYGITEMIADSGVGARMRREGLTHHGIELRFEGGAHRINFLELADGRAITVYGQQEAVKDFIAARLGYGAPIHFESEVSAIEGIETDAPFVDVTTPEGPLRIHAAYVAGCDGTHGVTAAAVPGLKRARFERVYPFAWLGILAEATPVSEELIYSRHERGFALYSMRSPEVVRLYLGVSPEERIEDWSDEMIWDELGHRLGDSGPALQTGPILERGITAMRNIVLEPMRQGRLLLAGDSAHIVPPTGAKGMNLALADVRVLVPALVAALRDNDARLLDAYSETCLRHVWRAEEFSTYMTQMLHPHPSDDFENRIQVARLRQVIESEPTARALARHYVDACSL